jgi:membrane protein DedA with SNARE-associated domain
MPWPHFLLWNALGGITWATTIGLLAYALGRSASGSLGAIGFAVVGVAVLTWVAVQVVRRLQRRLSARPLTGPLR